MSNSTLAGFWRQQPFTYLETYSFNRGPQSAELAASLRQELAATQQQLQHARYLDLARLRYKLRDLEEALRGGEYNVRLPLNPAAAAYGTRHVATLAADAGLTRHLRNLAERATTPEGQFMCPPVYRDALVFCNGQGQRVRVLNICFECQLMLTDDGQVVEADQATYDDLRDTLRDLGHPIGSERWR